MVCLKLVIISGQAAKTHYCRPFLLQQMKVFQIKSMTNMLPLVKVKEICQMGKHTQHFKYHFPNSLLCSPSPFDDMKKKFIIYLRILTFSQHSEIIFNNIFLLLTKMKKNYFRKLSQNSNFFKIKILTYLRILRQFSKQNSFPSGGGWNGNHLVGGSSV